MKFKLKKYTLTGFLLCWFMSVFSQKNDPVIQISTDTLIWKTNKSYSFNDSIGKPINEFQFLCAVYLPKDSIKFKNRLQKPSRVKVSFNYNRKQSFGLNPQNEDLSFIYNQTIINIYQLHTNKLRSSLYAIRFKPGYYGLLDNTFQEVYNELKSMNENFKLETDNGQNENKIKEWQMLVLKELEKYEKKR